MTSANSVALPLSLCFEYNYASFGSEALQRQARATLSQFFGFVHHTFTSGLEIGRSFRRLLHELCLEHGSARESNGLTSGCVRPTSGVRLGWPGPSSKFRNGLIANVNASKGSSSTRSNLGPSALSKNSPKSAMSTYS